MATGGDNILRGNGSLPQFEDDFIGSEEQLTELSLALGESRVNVLTGPPGVGKTRLAVEVACRLNFPDGVHFVALAGIHEPAQVPSAVASALCIWEGRGRPFVDSLVTRLRGRKILLMLDNCEQVAGACRGLAEALLSSCPDVRLLATSQMKLGIPGERDVPVAPLLVPGDGEPLATLAACEAVRLFIARAHAGRPGFRPAASAIRLIAEICRRLDGLPLAIELAATRLAVLTPKELASRLDERFSILARSGGGGLSRHRSLQMALEWSHDLLTEPERDLFRRLSVFSGPCDIEAVQAVAGYERSHRLLDPLAGLVAKSLVQADTGGSRAQYRMLETVRLFAADQLDRAGETAAARDRHSRWCLSLAERAEHALTRAEQAAWLERLDDSHNDIRSALTWSAGEGRADVALRLAAALAVFWRMRGCFREGRDRLTLALANGGDQPPAIRAKALWGLGFMALMLGDGAEATRALSESVSLARQETDVLREARCLLLLGNQALVGDRMDALRLLEESAVIARQAGDTWCQAHACALAARLHIDSGEADQAQLELDECLALARRARDDQSLRIGLTLLGELQIRRGEFDRADAVLTEALEVSRRLREPYAISGALELLGDIAISHGHWERARELYEAAEPLALNYGGPGSSMSMLTRMGSLARARGDDDAASELYSRALAIGRETGLAWGPAVEGLSEVAMSQGRWHEARDLLDEALRHGQAEEDPWQTAVATAGLARVAAHEGRLALAMSLYKRALDMCRLTGAVPDATRFLEDIAGLAVELDRPERAARLYGAAEALRQELALSSAPLRRPTHEAKMRRLRRVLGSERMEAAWAQGARLTFSEAISYALRGWGRRDRGISGWSSLTPAERSIVELVAQGLTNSEIGERLFISPRTVETHLTRIFSKLNLRSRVELRREAGRLSSSTVDDPPSKIRGFPRL